LEGAAILRQRSVGSGELVNKRTGKIPGLRIAIATHCILNCEYCISSGENYPFNLKAIAPREWIQILKVASDVGFRTFIITGGEPLYHTREVVEIVKELKRYNNCLKFRLSTSGVHLEKEFDKIEDLKLDRLVIHLDTLSESKYTEIMGKPLLKNVLRGIELAKNSFQIRINLVVTKKNYCSVFNVIDFCVKNEFDLKILDLNYFEFMKEEYWIENYQKLDGIIDYLNCKASSKEVTRGDGGYGIPMLEFTLMNSKIKVKNSLFGTTYAPICRTCPLFKHTHISKDGTTLPYCQEGLYEIFLSSDGKLRFCRHRTDLSLDFKKIDLDNPNEIKIVFQKMLKNYFGSFLYIGNAEKLLKKLVGGNLHE